MPPSTANEPRLVVLAPWLGRSVGEIPIPVFADTKFMHTARHIVHTTRKLRSTSQNEPSNNGVLTGVGCSGTDRDMVSQKLLRVIVEAERVGVIFSVVIVVIVAAIVSLSALSSNDQLTAIVASVPLVSGLAVLSVIIYLETHVWDSE